MGFWETIGKWIPNEISKTNALSNFTQYIPVVGQVLSGAQKGVSALDNFATAMGDKEEGATFGDAVSGAQLGISGTSASPGDWKTDYQNTEGRNFFDIAGQVGNYIPNYGSDGSGVGTGQINIPTDPNSQGGFAGMSPDQMGTVFNTMSKLLYKNQQPQQPQLNVTSPLYGNYTLGGQLPDGVQPAEEEEVEYDENGEPIRKKKKDAFDIGNYQTDYTPYGGGSQPNAYQPVSYSEGIGF